MDEDMKYAERLDIHIEALEATQDAAARLDGRPNFPVTDPRLGDPDHYPNHQAVPRSIYFYYVRINTTGDLYVRHYFYPGGGHNDPQNPTNPADWPEIRNDDQVLVPIVQDLVANARVNGTKYPLVGSEFLDIRWRRKSYVILFIDEGNWSVHTGSSGNPAVLFITTGGGTPNHSFFDGRNLDIPMPEGDVRSAFSCINHMKRNDAGDDLLATDDQFFQFKIFFDVKFASGARALTVIFDPDGNNSGPPIGPP